MEFSKNIDFVLKFHPIGRKSSPIGALRVGGTSRLLDGILQMRQSSKLQISAICNFQRQIALLVGRFSLVKGHRQYHSLLSVYSPFPHIFNSDGIEFFHINLTPIEQERGLVQHPRPRLWTNWRETRFLSPSQCKGTVYFWLKKWFWHLVVKTFSSKRSLAPRGSTTPRSGKEPSSWTLTSSARFAKLWIQKIFPFSPFRRCTWENCSSKWPSLGWCLAFPWLAS